MVNLSPETIAIAERLAAVQGVSLEEAIAYAIEQWALTIGVVGKPRDMSPEAIAQREALIDQIVEEISALPVRDPRPWREILEDISR
jgi:hypothetical protein